MIGNSKKQLAELEEFVILQMLFTICREQNPMTNNDEHILAFLYEQWRWMQEQDLLLAKIEGKLRAMRDLAQQRVDNPLTEWQLQNLQGEFRQLQAEIEELEQALNDGLKN